MEIYRLTCCIHKVNLVFPVVLKVKKKIGVSFECPAVEVYRFHYQNSISKIKSPFSALLQSKK